MIFIKRIYDNFSDNDGYRILVDRLWPRGVSKEKAKINLWMKEIAPTNNLRKWFSHDAEKWELFKIKYMEELKEKLSLLKEIKKIENNEKVITLVYAAKDENRNNAVVLKEVLETNN